jgi:hypothetical protein
MSQQPEPWELEGDSAEAKGGDGKVSVSDRVAYLKSHLVDGAPKVGASQGNNDEMRNAAVEASQSASRQQKGGEWDRVKYALDHLKPGAPKVGSSFNTSEMHADGGGMDDEDDMWRSAMNRYQQEHDDHPPSLSDINQHEYERLNNTMDRRGIEMEMDFDQPTQPPVAQGEAIHDDMDKLSLWQTFCLLYRKHSTVKYYIAALFILLAAAAIILSVSISNKNNAKKNCAVAKYQEKPFIILPDATGSITFRRFGTSLSASDKYLVVGGPDPSSAQDGITVGGGAFLYQRTSNGQWSPYSTIIHDDQKTRNDKFGESVSISEDSKVIAVGAPKDDWYGVATGSIYVIEAPFSSSAQPQRLTPNDLSPNDDFGESVSVSSTVLGGNVRVTNIAVGVPSDDDLGLASGSVYIYSKFYDTPPPSACGGLGNIKAGEWVQCQKLIPDDGAAYDRFGNAVAISGKTLVVGAEWDDDRGTDSGSAYAFSLGDDGVWSQQEKITGWGNKSDRFGTAVSTSGSRIVIGADFDDSQGDGAGAAYLYQLENGVWKLQQTFLPPSGSIQSRCGSSVIISPDGKTIMVGCPGSGDGGVVYVYHSSDQGGITSWAQLGKLSATDGALSATATKNMRLGDSLAMSPAGDNLLLVAGYGTQNGEIFTYGKNC